MPHSDWIKPGQLALVLAPMDGVLDAPMRELLARQAGRGGFDYCVSEFIRVTDEVPPGKVFRRDVPELAAAPSRYSASGPTTPSGLRVQVQILGGNPESLAAAAMVAVIEGARAIDLNFGCPAPTVNRHDGGASLLRFPERIRAIVTAVRVAVPREIPVSAKLRLGWEDPRTVFENAERALEGGASWLTLHGRTKVQGYGGEADWTRIGEVRRALGERAPIIANGDIRTLEDFKRCQDATGCHHFMIGRGAMADPWLPRRIRDWAEGREPLANKPTLAEFARDFVALAQAYSPDNDYATRRLKQWISLSQKVGGGTLFTEGDRDWLRLKRARTLEELCGLLGID